MLLMAIVMMAMSPMKMWALPEPTPLTVGTTQNITKIYSMDGDYAGLGSFTLTADGTFTATFGEEVDNIVIAKGDMSGLSEIVATEEANEYSGHLDAGSYILYAYVKNYPSSISVTTSFVADSSGSGEGEGEGGEGSSGSGSGDETTTSHVLNVGENTVHIYEFDDEGTDPKYYFTFTPTEPGQYTFSFSESGSPINVFAYFDLNGETLDGVENSSSFTSVALTAQTTYTLCVDGNDNDYPNATITITKEGGSGSGSGDEGNSVYTREMTYEWGTLCLPYSITYDANNGNHKLYTLTAASESTLTFTEIENGTNIVGGTPLAIKAVGKKNAETGKYNISVAYQKIGMAGPAKSITLENGYSMKGTYTEMTNKTGIYFIAQNKFWYADDAITIPANRAFINVLKQPIMSGAKALNIVVADEADGIKAVNSEQLTVNNGKFIENGKVVVVKNGKKFNVNGQRVK